MTEMTSRHRLVAIITVWTVAGILGLTVALVAVGFLGLWIAVGAFAGLGTTVVCGWLGQVLFATDVDAIIAQRRAAAEGSDSNV